MKHINSCWSLALACVRIICTCSSLLWRFLGCYYSRVYFTMGHLILVFTVEFSTYCVMCTDCIEPYVDDTPVYVFMLCLGLKETFVCQDVHKLFHFLLTVKKKNRDQLLTVCVPFSHRKWTSKERLLYLIFHYLTCFIQEKVSTRELHISLWGTYLTFYKGFF